MSDNEKRIQKKNEASENTDEPTVGNLSMEHLQKVLPILPEREREVLKLRFGIGDGVPRTLEEVGKKFMVARERIRQIEAKALRKEFDHPLRVRLPEDQIPGERPPQANPSNPAQEGDEP